jgi:hypothetical protein
MEWGKKKRVIWTCFIVASLVTMGGAAISSILLWVGMMMLAAIMGYCLTNH